MHSDDGLLMGEGQVDVFFFAYGCCDVLSLVIKLVATILSASDQLGHGAMLETKKHNGCMCDINGSGSLCTKMTKM